MSDPSHPTKYLSVAGATDAEVVSIAVEPIEPPSLYALPDKENERPISRPGDPDVDHSSLDHSDVDHSGVDDSDIDDSRLADSIVEVSDVESCRVEGTVLERSVDDSDEREQIISFPVDPKEAIDRLIEDYIRERLKSKLHQGERRIEVFVDGGNVLLKGQVSSYYYKQLAQESALHMKDVRSVTNEIIVLVAR